jgi:hypothetical protein
VSGTALASNIEDKKKKRTSPRSLGRPYVNMACKWYKRGVRIYRDAYLERTKREKKRDVIMRGTCKLEGEMS